MLFIDNKLKILDICPNILRLTNIKMVISSASFNMNVYCNLVTTACSEQIHLFGELPVMTRT